LKTRGRSIDEPGFTFIETIVGIVMLALVFAAVAPLTTGAAAMLRRLSKASEDLYKIAEAYTAFREACELTRTPPWVASESIVSLQGSDWTIAYLDGRKEKRWGILGENGTLIIEDGNGRHPCPASQLKVEPVLLEGRTIGIEISFASMGSAWRWREDFASVGY
jgi:type II secretory pathway pseudopilin PulG